MCSGKDNTIQLFHACSGNSQNYCPSVLEMTWELLPEAKGNSSQVISSTEGGADTGAPTAGMAAGLKFITSSALISPSGPVPVTCYN
jgi:hypothetical protein